MFSSQLNNFIIIGSQHEYINDRKTVYNKCLEFKILH